MPGLFFLPVPKKSVGEGLAPPGERVSDPSRWEGQAPPLQNRPFAAALFHTIVRPSPFQGEGAPARTLGRMRVRTSGACSGSPLIRHRLRRCHLPPCGGKACRGRTSGARIRDVHPGWSMVGADVLIGPRPGVGAAPHKTGRWIGARPLQNGPSDWSAFLENGPSARSATLGNGPVGTPAPTCRPRPIYGMMEKNRERRPGPC